MNRSLPSLALGALALLATFSTEVAADDRTDLTGTWVIDTSISDDPGQALRDARESSSNGSGSLARMARGISVFGIPIGSLPLPGGGSRSEADDAEAIVDVDYLLANVSEIRVLQQAKATQFEYGQNELVSYEHGVSGETEHGTVLADWDRHGFTVEHDLENGTRVTETYVLDPATDRLHWDVSVRRKKAKAIEISRVYDRKTSHGLNFVAVR